MIPAPGVDQEGERRGRRGLEPLSVACSAEDNDKLCNDLRAEVDHITEFLRQNKLRLSTDKTVCLEVGHKRQTFHILRPREILVNGERIRLVKYLGAPVDEKLTWNERYKKTQK